MERKSTCFPRWGTQGVTHSGDQDFEKELRRWYSVEESDALEGLVQLKARLRTLSTDDFWSEVTEGISRVMGAEMAFVMKRLLVNDQKTAVEMPPIGEPGSCLMAAAVHYCATDGTKHTIKQNTFHAYACPCAYMRHDKIFVIPQDLDDFITNNPNTVPIPVDAYMAVPLFAEDKCIAHFGCMWSKESSPNRRLSWAFVEMSLHSLEDMIGQRLLEGSNFVRPETKPPQRVIPHDAVSIAQSLRPYAGSLSHELRTPMQGVVGMLDVMYATVQDAVQSQDDPYLRKVFQNLKESIEVVQDSSRRAVVAADNVVHLYDMDPTTLALDDSTDITLPDAGPPADRQQPRIVVAGSDLPLARSNKRVRLHLQEDSMDSPSKITRLEQAASVWSHRSNLGHDVQDGFSNAASPDGPCETNGQAAAYAHLPKTLEVEPRVPISSTPTVSPPAFRTSSIRSVLQFVINEGLKVGGRPDFVSSTPTAQGERVEVRSRGSDGTLRQKVIEWSVDDALPEVQYLDEKDLIKLISCVVLNAIKFTNQNDGFVGVHAGLGSKARCMSITISDNGPGMPATFLPKLFKPFSQENGSLTRSSDGLGLGLMVAKGIARKLGGDLLCVRAETQSPNNGCEFEIRLPTTAGDVISRPASPFDSPACKRRDHTNNGLHPDHLPSPPYTLQPTFNEKNGKRVDSPTIDKTELDTPLFSSHSSPPPIPRSISYDNPQLSPRSSKLHEPENGRIKAKASLEIDRNLASKHPLKILVAEDNKINRKLLVSMLSKFGYRDVYEAHDGAEAVRQMSLQMEKNAHIDVVLMDLWMPLMDGYEATERILNMDWSGTMVNGPTVLAVTADVTDGALERAAQVGMKGFMTKPYKLLDLQRLITEYCAHRNPALEQPAALAVS